MEKITVKFQKMGCDIDIEKGLNHRIRTVIETDDKKWIFLEIGASSRPTLIRTNCKNQKEYLERYPNENYIHVDFCFRVDIPKDKYRCFSEEYREIQSQSFRNVEYSKENIIKFLQRFNKNIVDYELTSDFWIDDFCDKMGFFDLYDTRLKHKMEPLKIINKFFDTVKIKYQYTAWNYDQSVEYTEIDNVQMDLTEIVETPDGRKITKRERFIEQYGIDTYNILMEEYEENTYKFFKKEGSHG